MFPKEYLDYLIHFHCTRDYFECHEILEEYWKGEGNKLPIWEGLIQIAVGFYHYRRKNWNGAFKMFGKASAILKNEKDAIQQLGLHSEHLLSMLHDLKNKVHTRVPYESMMLPISNNDLLNEVKNECHQKGLIWNQVSNLEDLSLIHRHKLRDRSDVIEARNEALINKRYRKK